MSDPTIHGMFDSIYEMLTPSEAVPLIGVVSSAVKGVIAVAQLVAGLAVLLISTPLYLLCNLICDGSNFLHRYTYSWYASSTAHVLTGFVQLIQAILNIETIGVMQFKEDRVIFLHLVRI